MSDPIIETMIDRRRLQVTSIEDRLVTACERAAGHGRPGCRPPDDRGAWDRHTWNRYLREAIAQEHELRPKLRELHNEIATLERICSLRTAAYLVERATTER